VDKALLAQAGREFARGGRLPAWPTGGRHQMRSLASSTL
jgi:hypothetical protein